MARRHVRNWTKGENAVLLARYRTIGLAGVRPMLPTRSDAAIRKQASLLKVTDEEHSTRPCLEEGWPLPACDLMESLKNLRLRKWAKCVETNPRFGVAMIGGGYV